MINSRHFLVILCIIPGALRLAAQDSLLYQTVSISDTICTIESAISIIEKQTGLSFSYNEGLIHKEDITSLRAENDSLINVLTKTFHYPYLRYSIVGKHLVLYREFKTQSVNPLNRKDTVGYFEIKGRVFDMHNRNPVPFAGIYLFGKTVGIISNEDGEFVLKLNKSHIRDTLIISCVGYNPFKSEVVALINTSDDYYLTPNVISIQEVIIRKVSPFFILKSALTAIHENYSNEPAVLTSFYREMILKNNRYLMVSEAIIDTYKPGYTATLGTDRVKIIKGRKTEDVHSNDTLMIKLKAGLSTLLLLDVVDNLPDFITGKSDGDYDYRLSDIVVDNGTDNYAIEFKPAPESSSIYAGRILIGIRDMAFKWIEFNVDPAKLDIAGDLYIIKKPSYVNVRLLSAKYKIGYRKTGGKYYLNTIQCETEYRIKKRQQLAGSVYESKLEMAVTDIDTVSVDKFSFRDAARLNDFFTDQLGVYDETFWGEYNYITPDESLENAIVKLVRTQAK
jgi:hypothetical protein